MSEPRFLNKKRLSKKKYLFKFNGDKIIKFNVKKETSKNILHALRTIFKKFHNINFEEILLNDGFKLERCRFCKTEFAPIEIKYEIDLNFNIKIIDVLNIKKNYCYGKNKNCEGKKYNSNSIIFVSTIMDISETEALEFIKKRNKSPFYKSNFDNIEDYNKSQTRDITFFIKKYGEEEGEKRFNNFINKLKKNKTLEFYKTKFGEIEGLKLYKEINLKKDNTSLKYFLKKNNNDFDKALFEFNLKREKLKFTLNNMIFKYGKEEGTKRFQVGIEKRKFSNTLASYIIKLGKEEGTKRYKDILSKRISNLNSVSKESLLFFNKLTEILKEKFNFNNFKYGFKNELILKTKNNKYRFYDYLIDDLNLIIEYNGSIWHPRKENLTEEQFSLYKNPFSNKTANEIEKYDLEKKLLALENGYKIIEVWDFNSIEFNINFCINEIEKIINI